MRLRRTYTISIHAPRTGSDRSFGTADVTDTEFQSTLPARGATQQAQQQSTQATISIHAPRTGSDFFRCRHWQGQHISIHAPRTGSDQGDAGETCRPCDISIHAPRTGSDKACFVRESTTEAFQSTLPARGATTRSIEADGKREISIHAPRTGSDMLPILYAKHPKDFNPRSPHGERLNLVNMPNTVS